MTRQEMETKFREIVQKETKLDAKEQNALLDQFVYVWDAADLGLEAEELESRMMRIAGVLDYLDYMDKVKDDEKLWMLMNEIEVFWQEVRQDWSRSSWSGAEVKQG